MIPRIQIFILFSFIMTAASAQSTKVVKPTKLIAENRLTKCYEQHPFLMEALMLISDKEFANQIKAKKRKESIKVFFDKQPTEIRSCVEDIIQYAKQQNDPENLKHVVLRMKEVSSVIYASVESTQKTDAPKGKP